MEWPEPREMSSMSTADRRRRWDVIVVGGGPAGSVAAYCLARAGLDVAVVEKDRMPRHKTCGGGVVPVVEPLLPVPIDGVAERRCPTVDVTVHDLDVRLRVERGQPIITMTMRDSLDAVLLDAAIAAGAELIAPCRVYGLRSQSARVVLDTARGELDSRFVVAADGASSSTARAAGWNHPPSVVPALEWEIAVSADRLDRLKGSARIDLGYVSCGYAWMFPKARHVSVGILSTGKGRKDLRARLAAYLAELGLADAPALRRDGAVIPAAPRRGGLVNNRVVLVGDAAGFADPLTCEGISYAVLSGRLAADALIDGDFEEARTRQAYTSALRAELLEELRLARILANAVYGMPVLRRLFLKHMKETFTEAMVEKISGRSSYRQLLQSDFASVAFRMLEMR